MYTKNKIIIIALLLLIASSVNASSIRSSANWRSSDGQRSGASNCVDGGKRCVDSGQKIIEGIKVSRDCWAYSYDKTCDFPSKNDCRIFEHCYSLGDRKCLVQDSFGNCVNMLKEFICKSWDVVSKEDQKVRTALEAKDGPDQLVCKGIPCLDGNCVDKSYETNGEMMDSVSRLYAAKSMQPDKEGNFNLFQGSDMHCSKKPIEYKNCCGIGEDGWGESLGAECSKDEKTLRDLRTKKLCVYAGKTRTGTEPVHVSKHFFCCFPNMLDKVIQVQGRSQLYPDRVQSGTLFGTGERPDCRGLTIKEIESINFNKIDFGEFIEDFKKKFEKGFKIEGAGDIKNRIDASQSNIKKGDHDVSNKENNQSGWQKSKDKNEFDPELESR